VALFCVISIVLLNVVKDVPVVNHHTIAPGETGVARVGVPVDPPKPCTVAEVEVRNLHAPLSGSHQAAVLPCWLAHLSKTRQNRHSLVSGYPMVDRYVV